MRKIGLPAHKYIFLGCNVFQCERDDEDGECASGNHAVIIKNKLILQLMSKMLTDCQTAIDMMMELYTRVNAEAVLMMAL